MDSDRERERGITILAKCTAIQWRGKLLQIVDTPGHQDFGGEVERTMRMVDWVLLLVDAVEGPMPQTRYVLRKALARVPPSWSSTRWTARTPGPTGCRTSSSISSSTWARRRSNSTSPSSSRRGGGPRAPDGPGDDLRPLLEAIIRHVPAHRARPRLLQLYDPRLLRLPGTDRHRSPPPGGSAWHTAVASARTAGDPPRHEPQRLRGLKRIEATRRPREIVALAGFDGIQIGETVTSAQAPAPLPALHIDEPTISMVFSVNTSPFAGRDGRWVTSRNIKDRLEKELLTNVSIRVEPTDSAESLKVLGRGELQLAILIETMRREGFELGISNPEVITHVEDGVRKEPLELFNIDLPETYMGVVLEKMALRKGKMSKMVNHGSGRVRLEFQVPTRGLIGIRTELLTDTRGTAVMNSLLEGWVEWQGEIPRRQTGVLVADRSGDTTAYALSHMEDRGELFVGPGTAVYEGMLVGENARPDDMDVNVTKQKKLTNMRASTADDAIRLTPCRQLSLEQALEFIEQDELVEVTPTAIRLRKRTLVANQRTKWKKQD